MSDDLNDRILRLNAALDGELDALGEVRFQRELEADPALAAEYQRLVVLRETIRQRAPREAAPRALAERVAALATPIAPVETRVRLFVSRIASSFALSGARPLALAASTAAIGFVLGAGLMSLRTPNIGGTVVQSLVADYARAEIAGRPFDVVSSDRHTVKPWFATRATVSADIVDLGAQGFPLAGGRIVVVDRIPAPTLVYRHNEHLVAVTELPLDARAARGSSGIETVDGFHVARWSDVNLGYVAVSDMDKQTLAEFVAAFREGRKPGAEGKKD